MAPSHVKLAENKLPSVPSKIVSAIPQTLLPQQPHPPSAVLHQKADSGNSIIIVKQHWLSDLNEGEDFVSPFQPNSFVSLHRPKPNQFDIFFICLFSSPPDALWNWTARRDYTIYVFNFGYSSYLKLIFWNFSVIAVFYRVPPITSTSNVNLMAAKSKHHFASEHWNWTVFSNYDNPKPALRIARFSLLPLVYLSTIITTTLFTIQYNYLKYRLFWLCFDLWILKRPGL